MKYTPKETPTDWKRRWPDYLATASAVILVGAIVLFGVWQLSHRPVPAPPSPPAGFSSEWKCVDAAAKGGGLCWRDLPPAKPRPR